MQAQPTVSAQPSGSAIAALSATMLGLLVMAIANVFTEYSAPFEESIEGLGGWIPGASEMGAYPAKETIGLVVWLLAWAGCTMRCASGICHTSPGCWPS